MGWDRMGWDSILLPMARDGIPWDDNIKLWDGMGRKI